MKNKSDVIVATLVILCSVVLLGALIFSVSGNPFQRPHLRFSVDFKDITGIKQNSDVLYAGDKVGVVEKLEHLSAGQRLGEDQTIRAHIAILEEVALPANLDVLLSSESMLGEKHVALRRIDDSGGTLKDGARLEAKSVGGMLDSMVPGASDILADVQEIADSLVKLTRRLREDEIHTKVTATLANIESFTGDLRTSFSGDDEAQGISEKIKMLSDNLNQVALDLREFISGPEGSEEAGLSSRADGLMTNLEEFSQELTATLKGTPGGEPGLRIKLNNIADEVHVMMAGPAGSSDEGLRRQIDGVMRNVDDLVVEMQALVIWGQYVTGTLAEKPNRLIFGNKPNDVPTKEQLIEYLRTQENPYPVVIKENDPAGDPQAGTAASSPVTGRASDSESTQKKKRGLFRSSSRIGQ